MPYLSASLFPRSHSSFLGNVPSPGDVIVYPSWAVKRGSPAVRAWTGRFIPTAGSTTQGIQEAINYALENNGARVLICSGEYQITGTIDFYTGSETLAGLWNPATKINLSIIGAGSTATVISSDNGAIFNFDWSKFGGGFAGEAKLHVEGIGMQYTGTSQARTTSLMRLEGATCVWSFRDLAFNARHGGATYDLLAGLEIQDCWEMDFGGITFFQNLWQGIKINCSTRNGGNITFEHIQFQNVKLGCEIRGGQTTNNVSVKSVKCVSGGSNDEWPDHLTTNFSAMTAGQKATYEDGSTAIYVGTGLAINPAVGEADEGLSVYVGDGERSEVHRATAYDSGTGYLSLAAALANDYTVRPDLDGGHLNQPTGPEVIFGGRIGFITGFRAPCLAIHNGHFEGTAPGIFWGSGVSLYDCSISDATRSNGLGQSEEYGIFLCGKTSHEFRMFGGLFKANNRADGLLGKQINDWDQSGNVGGPVRCYGVQGYTSGGNESTRELDEIFTFGTSSTRRFGVGDRELHFNRSIIDFSPSSDKVSFSQDVTVTRDLTVTKRTYRHGLVDIPYNLNGTGTLNSNDYALVFFSASGLSANSTIWLPSSPEDGQTIMVKDIGLSPSYWSSYSLFVRSVSKTVEGGVLVFTAERSWARLVWSDTADQWLILDQGGTVTKAQLAGIPSVTFEALSATAVAA